jgi:hypothetical protein
MDNIAREKTTRTRERSGKPQQAPQRGDKRKAWQRTDTKRRDTWG